MTNAAVNNKRIAKNTLFLYGRALVVMLISLYTSRLVLNALGIDDYGIYSVVCGVVGLFSTAANALSLSITRFITYEVGKGDQLRINRVFCASYNLILPGCLIIFVIGEIVGAWFIYNELNIPSTRVSSAIWVLNASLFSFCFGLLNVPYNSLIVAYEKMSVFAYISVVEAFLKLAVCFCVIIIPFDKLIYYSILMAVVTIIIRLIYSIYCKKHFKESNFQLVKDKMLTREIVRYAGLSSTTHIIFSLNTQGVTILLNLFFGIILNASRGLAIQIQNIINSLVSNFTSAITPQITKSLAKGDYKETGNLVCKGARYIYLLLLFLAVPLLFETDTILHLWLGNVPPYTAIFVRLTIICSMLERLGDTIQSAIMASGIIKKYTFSINILTLLIFPITWLAYFIGLKPEVYYAIFFIVYLFVNIAQFNILNSIIHLQLKVFMSEVLYKICICTIISILVPLIIVKIYPPSLSRLFFLLFAGLLWTAVCVFITGTTRSERIWVVNKVRNFTKSIYRNEKINH